MARDAGSTWEDPRHFSGPDDFRAWLEAHHADTDVLWIGFWKKHTGREGLTHPQAVDEAVCFGWIDGLKRRVDDERYTLRFTPRKPKSNWSESNVERYRRLEAEGRLAEPGRKAWGRFQASEGTVDRSADRRDAELAPDLLARFQADTGAWSFFQEQPPGYRSTCVFWIMSAKRASTRERRLDKLLRFSAAEERLPEISGGPARDEP